MWCLKALHPSDPAVDITGLPDQFSGSTTCLNLQQVNSVKAHPSATGTYSVDVMFNPDVASFGYAKITDSVGTRFIEFINTQATSNGSTTDYPGALANTLSWFERWRLVYAGLSCYQDGPALSNQGTVAACQVPMRGHEYHAYPSFATGTSTAVGFAFSTSRKLKAYQTNDMPSYEKSQAMPNAFFGESKNGVYMPLRLGPNHQDWHSAEDLSHYVCSADENTSATFYPNVPWTTQASSNIQNIDYIFPAITANDQVIRWPTMVDQDAGTADTLFGHAPHPSLRSFAWMLAGDNNTSKVFRTDSRSLQLPQLAENVGHLSFRNLAVSTGLQFYFRVGVEAQCTVGSPYVPYLKVAPEYDQRAVESYFKISRELKDAYPVEFNDLGKLWDVIKQAARVVSGGLSFVPGPVGMIASGVHRLLQPTQPSGVALVAPPQMARADKPPAAALERAQRTVSAPVKRRTAMVKTRRT